MLKLDNNRKELYQWDVGVVGTLTIDGVDEVHFSNLRYGISFNIEVVDNKVKFPPEVLQTGADVFCWAFVREQNGGYTKKEQIFNVEKRPRPADYIFEPTEILSLQKLSKELESFKKSTSGFLADLEKGKEDKANKLTEYTEVETDEQYYSAKVVNGMFANVGELFEVINKENEEKFATKDELENLKTELQGDLDEIGGIIGGEDETIDYAQTLYDFYGIDKTEYPYMVIKWAPSTTGYTPTICFASTCDFYDDYITLKGPRKFNDGSFIYNNNLTDKTVGEVVAKTLEAITPPLVDKTTNEPYGFYANYYYVTNIDVSSISGDGTIYNV